MAASFSEFRPGSESIAASMHYTVEIQDPLCQIVSFYGAVAQLGERRVRNAKVGSSILLGSTKFPLTNEQLANEYF